MSNPIKTAEKQITLAWQNGLHVIAHSTGHDAPIPLDADPEVGGQGKGHRPLEMLLVGLAGCMTMDAVSILKKKRQIFDHFEVRFVEIEQANEHPKSYQRVRMHFTASGVNISEEALGRAIQLSYEKYCPANAMLGQAMQIDYTYEIINPTQPPSV